MRTKPIEELIPHNIDESLKEILNEFSNCINEIINFGTNILFWDIKKEQEGKDNHIPTVFLRNILEITDSISILIKNSSIEPSKILIRSLIENCYQLEYMIEKNEKQRALSFMVWRANNDLKYYQQFISKNQSAKQLKSKLLKDNLNLNIDKLFDRLDVQGVIDTKYLLLNKNEFKDINQEYIESSKKNKNPKWYSLYGGPKNFQELSTNLKKTSEYEFKYRKYSENVHSNEVTKGFVKAGNGYAQIIQIRNFENCSEVFVFTISIILETYIQFILKRIPEKLEEFKEWENEFDLEFNMLKNYKINVQK